jgi:hypothetical protein
VELKVYKYVIPVVDEPVIIMPLSAKLLHVHNQRGEICLWALVNPEDREVGARRFRVAGTGHPISQGENLDYIGTVHMDGGRLVFHVFLTE